jgi:hypothetical protein
VCFVQLPSSYYTKFQRTNMTPILSYPILSYPILSYPVPKLSSRMCPAATLLCRYSTSAHRHSLELLTTAFLPLGPPSPI